MFLKRLEIQGFKSFATKTTLDFSEDITAVVGPNGSGKSNIADAVRWILGEREAKSLRGAKSDDLIFAGTEKRARSGFAQASIYFDNSSGFFPVEYKEVVITRRIDRDGNSKFILNQSEVRLKDVIDFFARARLGARGLNIISQGESDTFLRAHPAERRALIEEMLGLKEYLIKKRQSERELQNTRANLDKAKVSLEEMMPHIKMLHHQVQRYAKRDKFATELSQLEKIFYGAKVKEIINALSFLEPKIISIDKDISVKKGELVALEKDLQLSETSEPQVKKQIEEIRIKRRELFNERLTTVPVVASTPHIYNEPVIAKNKKDPVLIIREIKELASSVIETVSVESLRNALKKILALIDGLEQNTISESVKAIPPVASPVVINPEFTAKIDALNKALDELDIAERKLTAEIDSFNSVFRQAIKAVEAKKDELDALEDEKAKIYFEKEKIKYRETELKHQLAAIDKTFAEFIDIPQAEECDFLTVERRIYRLRNELAAIGEVDESIIKESQEADERHNLISTQISELEQASVDLKTLIKELDHKIHREFSSALGKINKELSDFAVLMFGGGKIVLKLEELVTSFSEPAPVATETIAPPPEEDEPRQGIEIEVSLPKKRVKGLETLSGGERSLLATAVLFGLISISPPPFIILDEVDAVLDERNARRLGEILNRFDGKTQFIVVTHNRVTMESADALYGVTMGEDGSSKLVSLKLN